MSKQLTIIRGEDRTLILRNVFRDSDLDPFPLAGWTKITIELKKQDRSLLVKDTVLANGIASFLVYEDVTFIADNVGVAGDSISLTFDGSDDINTVVGVWNGANPGNTVSHDAVGTEVLADSGGALTLSGGLDNFTDIEVINETLSKISVKLTDVDTKSLKAGPNQSFKVIIDKGEHPNGDRRIVVYDSALNIIDQDL